MPSFTYTLFSRMAVVASSTVASSKLPGVFYTVAWVLLAAAGTIMAMVLAPDDES